MKKFILASAIVAMMSVLVFAGVKYAEEEKTDYERPDEAQDISYSIVIENNDRIEVVSENEDFFEDNEFKRPHIPEIPLDDELLDYIWKRTNEENLSYELVLAIIAVESDFNSDARSPTKDSGLAQINAANIDWLSKEAGIDNVDPMNPFHSVDMMISLINYEREYYYSQGFPEEDTYWFTLIAYNMGRGKAIKYINNNGYNYAYAKKVDAMKQYFEENAVYE